MKNKFDKRILTYIIVLLITNVYLIVLFSNVTLYADDYYYSTFWRDGIAGFFKKSVDHYLTFNGRVLVHLLAHTVLAAKDLLFPAVNLLLIGGIFAVFAQSLKLSKIDTLRFITLAELLLLLLPSFIWRESILWVSAAMNYLLPALLSFAAIRCLTAISDGRSIKFSHLAIGFLAGASIEQCGLAVIATAIIASLASLSKRNIKIAAKTAAFAAAPALGVITIFASPATMSRLAGENSGGNSSLGSLFSSVFELLKNTASLSPDGIFPPRIAAMADSVIPSGIVLAVFFVLLPLSPHLQKNLGTKFKILSPVLALSTAAVAFIPDLSILRPVFFVLAIACAVFVSFRAVFLSNSGSAHYLGYTLAFAVFSLAAMLFTSSITPRTVLVFMLVLISHEADILVENKIKFESITAVCFASFVLISSIPMLDGYIFNRRLYDENLKNLKSSDSGYAEYDWSYRDEYRHTMMHDDGYFYQTYRECYGISPQVTVKFCGNNTIPLYFNESESPLPSIYEDGIVYLPLENTLTSLGGTSEWRAPYSHFVFCGTEYTLNHADMTVTAYLPESGKTYSLSGKTVTKLYLYVRADTVEEIFGISISYSEDKHSITAHIPAEK